MQIGEITLNRAADMVRDKLISYQREIDEAYVKAEDALTISFKVKIFPDKEPNSTAVETSIDFVPYRVKDKSKSVVSENQLEMFPTKKVVRFPLTIEPKPSVGRPCWMRGHGLGG